ncbi:MAG: beta-ketoacyl-[acyl-carrier-protein] synthase family protein [Planctomycetota bacterium]|jgi:3-oxoacyl-[acyl-carrier-protein] synthase II
MRRVAVTGFGVVSPIGIGRAAFWDSLRDGRSGVGRISRFDCATFEVQLAGEVDGDLELHERVADVAARDPKVGFAFAAVSEALADAGLECLAEDVWLHVGTSLEIFPLERTVRGGEVAFRTIAEDCIAGRSEPIKTPLDAAAQLVAEVYGRPGRSFTNCSACAAGAQAIGHGFRSIRSGRCRTAVCGGFDSMINPLGVGGFQLLGALTTDTDRGATACRPFDSSRNGAVLGEGAGVVVLEDLERARSAGRRIMAEVCGYGSTLDAYSLSAPDPEGDGAARAMSGALGDAGISPGAVSHISAHGTGTRLNDEVEATAIRRVFDGHWEGIPVSSVKAMTGHLIAAAGAVEVGACLMALEGGVMSPNPHLENVGKGCELNYVAKEAEPFAGEYVLTNSFGFGGQNAALVLRRYDGRN